MAQQLTEEVLKEKINALTARFDELGEQVKQRQETISKLQEEITAIIDEQKRMQGEYRALINLGKDFGLLVDEDEVQTPEVVEG